MFGRDVQIAVIGAGATGGIIAGFIARAGYNVEVVCKHQELADKIKSGELHIFGRKGDHRVSIPAVAKISELSGPKDIFLLTVKAADVLNAARESLPFVPSNSLIVPMENGMGDDALAEIFPREQIVGCVIDWGATMHSLGELEMTATGKFAIGYTNNEPDQRLLQLKKILSTVLPVEISENIRGRKYYKLVVNSCINSIGAICGLHLGEMFSIKKIRSIFAEIMHEAVAVADALGIKPESLSGKIDYRKFLQGSGFFDNFTRRLIIYAINVKYNRLKSSSLQSLERGKPTEIDYLNGYIAENGKKYKIPTPVNDKIVQMVKEIEAGRRKIALENLNDPFFTRFEYKKAPLLM
ncbi:2-dehydropantoate 2-reductase [Omnitrophica bacterium]|nr:2-dehydropantoate 2-reductase [Candidatus Omnitrophota bacterium]